MSVDITRAPAVIVVKDRCYRVLCAIDEN